MQIDLHVKAQQLLETLANSIHDRDPKSLTPFCFNVAEVQAAHGWLESFVDEIKKDCVCV